MVPPDATMQFLVQLLGINDMKYDPRNPDQYKKPSSDPKPEVIPQEPMKAGALTQDNGVIKTVIREG